MFKIFITFLVLLIPVFAFSEDISGQTTRTQDGGSYTELRSSDGSSAAINVYPNGGISIYTTPSTDAVIGDLNRAHDATRQAIDRLNRDHD
jgi:hypothetical protein